MGEEKPSLRTLYTMGEKEVFLRTLLPTSSESEDDDFRKGLGASNEQMELVVELVNLAFEKSGLSDYESFDDPEALNRLNTAVAEPVLWLAENLPEVPTWFTNQWCTHIIRLLWKRRVEELADKRAKIRDGKLPLTVASAKKTPEKAVFSLSRSAKALSTLQDAILRVEVFNDRKDPEPEMVQDLPISNFLVPGRIANKFPSYSYDIFMRAFEKAINRGFGSNKPHMNIFQGTLGYLNQDNRFKSFYRQESFEFALRFLFSIRDDDNILSFIYRKETEDERNARLDGGTKKISASTSPVGRNATTQFNVSSQATNLTPPGGDTKAPNKKWTSPPPSPSPHRALPPMPMSMSPKQLVVLNSPERARDVSFQRTARKWQRAAMKQAEVHNQETVKAVEKVAGAADLNKPLPLIPASEAQSSVLSTPKGRAGSKSPMRASSRSTTTATTNSQETPISTPEPTPRKPFLVKRGGLSTGRQSPSKPQTRTTQPANTRIPATLTHQAKQAWESGNKSNASISKASTQTESSARTNATPKPMNSTIYRGGPSRAGDSGPPDNEPSGAAKRKRALLPRSFVRSVEAKKTPQVITPQDGPSRISSQRADHERSETLTSLEGHARRSPKKPKELSVIGVAMTAAKKRISSMLSPKSPKSPYIADVQEITGRRLSPGEPLTPPSNEQEHEAVQISTSSALSRITTTIKHKEVIENPATKKTLGLAKAPKTRIAPKTDRFETQDQKYPNLYTEVERRTYRRGGDEFFETPVEVEITEEVEETRGIQEVDANELGDEDDSRTPADYMVEQFQKMQNMSELTQMYEFEDGSDSYSTRPWTTCCELFQLDPSKTSIEERVTIVGLKTPIYQYQALGIYWQMRNSRTIGGGFVADEMGLGKTLSFLAYVVVERQLAFLWEQVEKSWAKVEKDQAHLQPGEAGSNAVCPSHNSYGKGWIACPCASPVTSNLAAKPGVRLAIVPPSLVPTWIEQWDTHVDITNTLLQMSLVIAHDGSNVQTYDGKMDNRDGRHTAVIRRVQANRINFHQSVRNSGQQFFPDRAQVGQERILVVTTRDHYNKTWAARFEYQTHIMPEDKNSADDMYKGKSPGVVYGIAMIDECHEDWQKNKGRSAIAASLPRSGRPFIWGYSGTPLNSTPRSIEGILWAIESLWPKRDRTDKTRTGLEQEQDSDLWRYCWKTLNNICNEFEIEVKKGSGNQIIFQDFYLRYKPFLTRLMIRRTAETAWFGHPLIKLMPHFHQDIILAHNPEFDPKIEQFKWLIDSEIDDKLGVLRKEWRSGNPITTVMMPVKFSFNSETRLRYKQRLFASFPYLCVLGAISHPDHLDLTVEELKNFRGVDEKRNPYYKHLKNITETSPKMMWLYNFIKELDMTKDVNGEEQKVVVMSEFNQVAFILKLWIERHLKGKAGRVGIIYAGQRPRDRKAVIEAFIDAKNQKKERKQKANYQFLVGTTRIIGAGLQLTRSCTVVIMEPDYEFHRELQGYARVHRIGQRNPESRSYRLIDALDSIEQSIIEKQAARGEFPGRPDKIEGSNDALIGGTEEPVKAHHNALPNDPSDENGKGKEKEKEASDSSTANISIGHKEQNQTQQQQGQDMNQQHEQTEENPYAYAEGIYDEYTNQGTEEMDDETRAILSEFPPSPTENVNRPFSMEHYIPESWVSSFAKPKTASTDQDHVLGKGRGA